MDGRVCGRCVRRIFVARFCVVRILQVRVAFALQLLFQRKSGVTNAVDYLRVAQLLTQLSLAGFGGFG